MPAKVRGKFEHEKEMYILPRVYGGMNGYHVVTPLVRTDVGYATH